MSTTFGRFGWREGKVQVGEGELCSECHVTENRYVFFLHFSLWSDALSFPHQFPIPERSPQTAHVLLSQPDVITSRTGIALSNDIEPSFIVNGVAYVPPESARVFNALRICVSIVPLQLHTFLCPAVWQNLPTRNDLIGSRYRTFSV